MNPLPYPTYLQAQRRMIELEAGPCELRPLARADSDHDAPARGLRVFTSVLIALLLLPRQGFRHQAKRGAGGAATDESGTPGTRDPAADGAQSDSLGSVPHETRCPD